MMWMLLSALAAQAGEPIAGELQSVRWADDGSAVIVEVKEASWGYEHVFGYAGVAYATDFTTGKARAFTVWKDIDADAEQNTEESDHEPTLARWRENPGKAELDKWKAGRTFVDGTTARECKDQVTKTDVIVDDLHGYDDSPAGGAWKGDQFTYDPGEGADIALVVRRGKKVWEQKRWARDRYWNAIITDGAVQAHLSPSCNRVVWTEGVGSGWWVRDGAEPDIEDQHSTVFAVGPEIELLAGEAIATEALPAMSAKLTKHGWASGKQGTAKKERDASVIYAAAGWDEEAKALANTIPGGATIEALTWKANGDIVIAIGKSAVAP